MSQNPGLLLFRMQLLVKLKRAQQTSEIILADMCCTDEWLSAFGGQAELQDLGHKLPSGDLDRYDLVVRLCHGEATVEFHG